MRKKNVNFLELLVLFFIFFSCDSTGVNDNNGNFHSDTFLTVMIYMSGGAGASSLSKYLHYDLEEIRQGTADRKVRAIVLADVPSGTPGATEWSGTRLYEISGGEIMRKTSLTLGLGGKGTDNLDIASTETLNSFITYVMNNYKDEYFGLILWGHGSGIWRSASTSRVIDDKTAVRSAWDAAAEGEETRSSVADINEQFLDDVVTENDKEIDTTFLLPELSEVLQNREDDLLFVAFDTCLGAQYEVLYEFSKERVARYMVAAEDLVPAVGWNYHNVFTEISNLDNADISMKTPSGEEIVRAIVRGYSREERVQAVADISVFNLDVDKIDMLSEKFSDYNRYLDGILKPVDNDGIDQDALKDTLRAALGSRKKKGDIQTFLNVYNPVKSDATVRMVDIGSFVTKVTELPGFDSQDLREKSNVLLAALDDVIVARWYNKDGGRYLDHARGLSIGLNKYNGQGLEAIPKFYSSWAVQFDQDQRDAPNNLQFVLDGGQYWTLHGKQDRSEYWGLTFRLFIEVCDGTVSCDNG